MSQICRECHQNRTGTGTNIDDNPTVERSRRGQECARPLDKKLSFRSWHQGARSDAKIEVHETSTAGQIGHRSSCQSGH